MAKNAFITGLSGQDGAYLAKFLLRKKYRVFGLVRNRTEQQNLQYLKIDKKVSVFSGDIRNSKFLEKILLKVRPQEIYNLAAHSFVGDSWERVELLNETNYLAVIQLLDIVRTRLPKARFCQATTGEIFNPTNPYAVSKLAAYHVVRTYRQSYGLFCGSAICYNHESPLRSPRFVTRKISLGVARIKLGLDDRIELGDIDSIRDWGFAGDYVKAMWLMLQQSKPADYIIATGKNHSIKDVLNVAFQTAGIGDWKPYITISKKFQRPVALKRLTSFQPDAQKKLGWKPRVDFKQLITMMVKEDLRRLKKKL